VQVLYAWLMTFGLLGLCQALLAHDRPWVRFVSDSSYWLYLVHLPLVIFGQGLLLRTGWPALVEFGVLLVASSAVLLVSYRYLVRYTPIGTLLNGRRVRERAVKAVPATAPSV
jgi:peptidoglycan/LPS O-acetylase OafA/YrhL